MNLRSTLAVSAVVLAFAVGSATSLAAPQEDVNSTLELGNKEAERAHNVSTADARAVGSTYPDRWIMAVRASDYADGHEPYRVIDGKDDTHWQVSGPPPHPMRRHQWIVLELNKVSSVEELSIRWLGDESHPFTVYRQPWSDATDTHDIYKGKSGGEPDEMETYTLSEPARTRAIRIEFPLEEGEGPRGIQEVRVGGLSWPGSYPPAAYDEAPIRKIKRHYYVEFERLLEWPQFNLKRALADGGSARRIRPREDAFEGGHVDFDIAVEPDARNWITLKMWESHEELMAERGDGIVLVSLSDDPVHHGRWFRPKFTRETHEWNPEWYGEKPTPGRWVYVTYPLPREITDGRTHVRLRLQGVGNYRRDHPMRSPAPPVYTVHSSTRPGFGTDDEAGR